MAMMAESEGLMAGALVDSLAVAATVGTGEDKLAAVARGEVDVVAARKLGNSSRRNCIPASATAHRSICR